MNRKSHFSLRAVVPDLLFWSLSSVVVLALAITQVIPSLAEGNQSGQQTGYLDFVARVTPSGGHPEPARATTFYLLRKSFQDIQSEADGAEPVPKLDDFVADLTVSPELKAWMIRNQSVELSGPDFPKSVTADDVLKIKEFYDAYMNRNAGDRTVSLPKPKFNEAEREKRPDRYQQQVEEYHQALKHYIELHPETKSMLYLALEKSNPGSQWKKILNDRKARVRRRTLELAELHYLVTKVDTDLEGHARLDNVPAGEYWLSSLENDAIAGDMRVRWDLPVRITAGRNSVELSNLNGIETRTP
jgi:hypothetical protein